ncbi:Aste57867_11039 [Aphanomyces stellatus]|uniref:Aste57867_11039 protein n=1 Tax=Aphanomyces stellatus TaxID=120398 RepID=A0A485KRU7_9STRA|nr:hypothetical protein As57867_010997 [Aphanomyces stellatus]VFT87907.1 Aste57867_11039 [Aphanomyces stellatus]
MADRSVPKYRQRNARQVSTDAAPRPKAYTVNDESRFILVRNIPSLGACDELVQRFRVYGAIEEHQFVDDHDDATEFLDVLWLRYEHVNAARRAKTLGVKTPFYGNLLHVAYCPEDEEPLDTRAKLDARRELLQTRFQGHLRHHLPADVIGPRLPSAAHAPIPSTVSTLDGAASTTVVPPSSSEEPARPPPKQRRRI